MNRHLLAFMILLFCPAILLTVLMSCGEKSPQGPEPNGHALDTIPPATVTDLIALTLTSSSVALVWISPGDDGISGQAAIYDIRYAFAEITDQTWSSAVKVDGAPTPKPAGQVETLVITNLPPGEDLYYALRTYDEAQNESKLSNNVKITTKPEEEAPAKVTDLAATAISDTEFLLTWTAPGDDGMVGTASEYDIRYDIDIVKEGQWASASQAANEPTPKPAGSPDSFTVSGLEPGKNYCFALKTADELVNWSEISNPCPGLALSDTLWAVPHSVRTGGEVQIPFRAISGLNTRVFIWRRAYEWYTGWKWYVFRRLVNGIVPSGTHIVTWDTLDDEGNPIPETIAVQYKVRLHWGETLVDSSTIQIIPTGTSAELTK